MSAAAGRAAAARAAGSAEKANPGWGLEAMAHLSSYARLARRTGSRFITKDAREYAERRGLPPPPDKRAWGHIIKRAQSAGIVKPVDKTRPPHVHGVEVTVWAAA